MDTMEERISVAASEDEKKYLEIIERERDGMTRLLKRLVDVNPHSEDGIRGDEVLQTLSKQTSLDIIITLTTFNQRITNIATLKKYERIAFLHAHDALRKLSQIQENTLNEVLQEC